MAKANNTKENKNISLSKLEVLITIVNRIKAEYYVDLIQSFEVNMQMIVYGEGTANEQILQVLGITSSQKAVIISIVNKKNSKDILNKLSEKFKTIKNGKGIAYTIPMSSIIGVSIFSFLSNNKAYIENNHNLKEARNNGKE